jgi:hypothetical protein
MFWREFKTFLLAPERGLSQGLIAGAISVKEIGDLVR